MGRPLNKKYFGNFNIGTNGYTPVVGGNIGGDDGIGGEGIDSISFSDVGSWMATAGGSNSPLAGLALPAPSIPGGVQATWNLVYGAAAVSTGAGHAGLNVGDVYTYEPIIGSRITVTSTASNATFHVNVAGTTSTLITDTQGVNLNLVTGAGTSTFLVDVSMKIASADIVQKGSGYIGTETFTVTLSNSATGTVPVGTVVLTTDSGAREAGTNHNVATNQDNAIIIRAKTTSGGTVRIGDIQQQKGSHRYKIKTADGVAVCKLVATTSLLVNQAYMVATATGGTYYVTKLTAHRAHLVTKTGNGALNGKSVKWTFGAPSATVVQIENA